MRCIVTGGCGFIGSHVVDALVARGENVTVLDDLSSGTADNLNGQAQLINGSILDTSAVDGAVRGADCVLHLAAWARVPRSIEDPLGTHQVNVVGTLNSWMRYAGSRCPGSFTSRRQAYTVTKRPTCCTRA